MWWASGGYRERRQRRTAVRTRRALVAVAVAALTACSATEQVVGTVTQAESSAPNVSSPASSATVASAAPSTLAPADPPPSSHTASSSPSSTSPHSPTVTAGSSYPLPANESEASGVVAGTADDAFFVVDDTYRADSIVAVRADGTEISRITVDGMAAENAEAIAAALCTPGDTEMCLYVGDIGDHRGRESVTIYQIPEPTPGQTTATATAWTYTYADGPTDAESLFLAPDGRLVVISKPDDGAPHRIFQGPPGGGTLHTVGSFTPPQPTVPIQSLLVGNVVTDATYDGTRVLLLTYDQITEYTAPQVGADPVTFPTWPHRALPTPRLPQAEGIGSLADNCGYVTVSEAAITPHGSIVVSTCDR